MNRGGMVLSQLYIDWGVSLRFQSLVSLECQVCSRCCRPSERDCELSLSHETLGRDGEAVDGLA
eukprot:4087117-Amphidinium_carterae.1